MLFVGVAVSLYLNLIFGSIFNCRKNCHFVHVYLGLMVVGVEFNSVVLGLSVQLPGGIILFNLKIIKF
jgi:hypothetical protein